MINTNYLDILGRKSLKMKESVDDCVDFLDDELVERFSICVVSLKLTDEIFESRDERVLICSQLVQRRRCDEDEWIR